MRRKRESWLSFPLIDSGQPKIVVEYQEKCKRLSGRLDQHPDLVTLAHRDLRKVSRGGSKGRKGVYTSESILRTLVVMTVENLSLRKTIALIGTCPFLQDFIRLGPQPMMDFTFLDKCFHAIEPETWQQMNDVLARQAAAEGIIDPSAIRADTTVVEANIHYPTDSSLLWDSWRVTTRLLKRARERCRYPLGHRFHDGKVKGLHLFVTRYVKSSSKSRQRAVRPKRGPADGSYRESVRAREKTLREPHWTRRNGAHRAAHAGLRPPRGPGHRVVLSKNGFPQQKLISPVKGECDPLRMRR